MRLRAELLIVFLLCGPAFGVWYEADNNTIYQEVVFENSTNFDFVVSAFEAQDIRFNADGQEFEVVVNGTDKSQDNWELNFFVTEVWFRGAMNETVKVEKEFNNGVWTQNVSTLMVLPSLRQLQISGTNLSFMISPDSGNATDDKYAYASFKGPGEYILKVFRSGAVRFEDNVSNPTYYEEQKLSSLVAFTRKPEGYVRVS